MEFVFLSRILKSGEIPALSTRHYAGHSFVGSLSSILANPAIYIVQLKMNPSSVLNYTFLSIPTRSHEGLSRPSLSTFNCNFREHGPATQEELVSKLASAFSDELFSVSLRAEGLIFV